MSRRSFEDPGSIEARQALLDNRAERSHPKRHRTRRRSKALAAKKKDAAAQRVAAREKRIRRFKKEARAYWRGERDGHP